MVVPSQRKQLKRYEHRNELRYLTCSCFHRLQLLNNDAIKNHFVKYLCESQTALDFKVYAWVLMPDHFHLLLRPKDQAQTIEQILRRIKSGFAYSVINRWDKLHAPILKRITDKRGRRRFWQSGGGYDRNIFSEEELIEKIGYIHRNPVNRQLVDRPSDWKWSSARWYEQREDYDGPAISNPM